MKAAVGRGPNDNAQRQLASFTRRIDATDQQLIRAVRRAVRKPLPTANELVYDNYNFFVIGYSPLVNGHRIPSSQSPPARTG